MAYGPSQNRTRSQKEPQKPNLIPIMNLFIVVIPMLMTIMVSVRLAMIQITLPASGAGKTQEEVEKDQPSALTLALLPDRFEIKVEGIKEVIKIPQLSTGNYDYVSLDQHVASLKEENKNQSTFEILPDSRVRFDTLLRSIDICKSNDFPNIKYLTTFTKVYRAKQ